MVCFGSEYCGLDNFKERLMSFPWFSKVSGGIEVWRKFPNLGMEFILMLFKNTVGLSTQTVQSMVTNMDRGMKRKQHIEVAVGRIDVMTKHSCIYRWQQ